MKLSTCTTIAPLRATRLTRHWISDYLDLDHSSLGTWTRQQLITSRTGHPRSRTRLLESQPRGVPSTSVQCGRLPKPA